MANITYQHCPDQHTDHRLRELLNAPGQWVPAYWEMDLFRQSQRWYNERLVYWEGRYVIPPVSTNSSAVCFI